jgi:tetratricopeptide (TPR) repeat protein
MSFVSRTSLAGLAFATFFAIAPAAAQTTPAPSFEELSNRAQALVDSDPAQASDLLKQALALQPKWAEGWLNLGGTLYQLGRYDDAVEAFHKGIDLAPRVGTGWAFLGLAEFELKHDERAYLAIQRGEALGVGRNVQFEAAVRQTQAMILVHHSLFDQALAQLQPLSKMPNPPQAVIDTAGLIALTINKSMSELPEKTQKVVRLAGQAYWATAAERPEEAETAYKQLLSEYGTEPGVHYAHGLHLMTVDERMALDEFANELKQYPNHWPSMLVSAFLLSRGGDPDAALKLVERAKKAAPPTFKWLCDAEAGRAYLTKGDVTKALANFEEAAKLEPDNAQVHHFLEQAYKRAGRKADAQRESQIFLKLKQTQDPFAVPNAKGDAAPAPSQ